LLFGELKEILKRYNLLDLPPLVDSEAGSTVFEQKDDTVAPEDEKPRTTTPSKTAGNELAQEWEAAKEAMYETEVRLQGARLRLESREKYYQERRMEYYRFVEEETVASDRTAFDNQLRMEYTKATQTRIDSEMMDT